jgi:hypothetical protein
MGDLFELDDFIKLVRVGVYMLGFFRRLLYTDPNLCPSCDDDLMMIDYLGWQEGGTLLGTAQLLGEDVS